MISPTRDVTILPNPAPMTTPTAMSITLPLTANSLNSCNAFIRVLAGSSPTGRATPAERAPCPARRPHIVICGRVAIAKLLRAEHRPNGRVWAVVGHVRETRSSPEASDRYSCCVTADAPRLTPHDLSRVGLFPLPNVVLFPSQQLSLHVFEPRYRKLVSDVIEQGLVLAVPRLKPGFDASYYGAPPVFETCGIGQITEYSRLPDGRFNIVVLGLGRGRILDELRTEPYRVARFAALADEPPRSPMVVETLRTELVKLLRRVAPSLTGPAKELEARMRGAASTSECA